MAGKMDGMIRTGRRLALGVAATGVTMAATADSLFAQTLKADSTHITHATTGLKPVKAFHDNARIAFQTAAIFGSESGTPTGVRADIETALSKNKNLSARAGMIYDASQFVAGFYHSQSRYRFNGNGLTKEFHADLKYGPHFNIGGQLVVNPFVSAGLHFFSALPAQTGHLSAGSNKMIMPGCSEGLSIKYFPFGGKAMHDGVFADFTTQHCELFGGDSSAGGESVIHQSEKSFFSFGVGFALPGKRKP